MAHATTYYWDVNGATAGSGVTATQHTWAATFFTTDPTGDTATSGNTMLPGASDDVVFSAGTDATIAYSSAAVTDSVRSITLNTNGTGTLTLGGTSAALTIGAGGLSVTESTQSSPTTDVLQITTGSTTGSLTLGTAQTWSNTDTTGGLVDVETPVIINGLWNMASGYIRLGKAASDSGSGGVEITGANVTLSSPSGTPANAAFGTGTVVFTTGSLSYVSASSGAATFANTFNINGGFTFGGNGGSGVNMTFSGTGTISGSPTVTFSDTSGNPGTTFSNTVTLDSNATFTGAGNSTFSGGIADDGGTRSLSYTGTGRLTLSAASTYTGGTSISGGKVFANSTTGSSTGTGSISITGGTLLGTGSIAPSAGNNINIGASGTLFPGTGANSTGGLTLTNASTTQNLLTAAPNATLSFDLNTGVASSKLTLAGSVGIGTGANAELAFNSGGTGSTNTLISITDLSGGTLSGGAYDLIVGSSNGQYSGLTFGGTATDGGSIITGGLALASNSFTSTYASSFLELNNGVLEVDVASVPEPSTWCLLLAGLGIFWLVPALRRTSGVLISD